jgi:signal transduction histidine kinase
MTWAPCPRRWSCRSTASSRRRSPTSSSTPPGARATVDLAVSDREIRLDVTDDGGPAGRPAAAEGQAGEGQGGERPAGPGLGIVGMRERIAAFGGRLVAEPLAGRGFRVTAEVPIPGAV